jgi:hypothetical protein
MYTLSILLINILFPPSQIRIIRCSSVGEEHLMGQSVSVCRVSRINRTRGSIVGTHCCATMTWDHISATTIFVDLWNIILHQSCTNFILSFTPSSRSYKQCQILIVTIQNRNICSRYTGLFKKKYTLPKIYFTKTTDAKSMSCVRMERKSLKVLISMI